MAGEQLKTTAELLAGFPDNSTGLIEAVDSRNLVISAVNGVGYLDTDVLGVPIDIIDQGQGVAVDILSNIPPSDFTFTANFYRLDANNHFVPSYVDQGITVPPGTVRIVESDVQLLISKVGGGTSTFLIGGTKAGVPYLPERTVTLTSTQELFVFTGARLIDVSLAEPLSLRFTPVDGADDLRVYGLRASLKMVLA